MEGTDPDYVSWGSYRPLQEEESSPSTGDRIRAALAQVFCCCRGQPEEIAFEYSIGDVDALERERLWRARRPLLGASPACVLEDQFGWYIGNMQTRAPNEDSPLPWKVVYLGLHSVNRDTILWRAQNEAQDLLEHQGHVLIASVDQVAAALFCSIVMGDQNRPSQYCYDMIRHRIRWLPPFEKALDRFGFPHASRYTEKTIDAHRDTPPGMATGPVRRLFDRPPTEPEPPPGHFLPIQDFGD